MGVSALELCNANCTWSRSATIPLYPYDAGTDNGLSYMVSYLFVNIDDGFIQRLPQVYAYICVVVQRDEVDG